MFVKKLLIALVVCILCTYCQGQGGQRCQNGAQMIKLGLTDQDKQVIVETHNRLRGMITAGQVPGQPQGTNLQQQTYNEQLGQQARQVSLTCQFQHMRQSDQIGQNMYMQMSQSPDGTPDFAGAVQSWFNEYQNYRYGPCCGMGTGHYTQLVWADSNQVGCDFVRFYDGNYYNDMLTCNYYPGGNVQGQVPYQTGGYNRNPYNRNPYKSNPDNGNPDIQDLEKRFPLVGY